MNDRVSRREMLLQCLGLTVGLTFLPHLAAAEAPPLDRGPRRTARSCIYLYMGGGMSHLDTFDPKPGRPEAGPLGAIPTTADGLFLSENLPLLAKRGQHLAVVRSLSSNQGAHEQGEYLMRTGYVMRGTIRHPSLGAWSSLLLPRRNQTLPAYVTIGAGSNHPRSGFLPSRHAPLPVGDPNAGLANSSRPASVSEQEYAHRQTLLREFNEGFERTHDVAAIRARRDVYDEALALMTSRDLAAFDIKKEPEPLRAAYGEGNFGQGCLLARRLVERGVRFVEVQLGGWDTHDDNFNRVGDLAATLDRGVSTLLEDLRSRGMLDETLVVIASEFGRSPTINGNQGRDHYPKVFSGLLAGGGVIGGQAVGASDERGAVATSEPLTVQDFNATIAYALGLPLELVTTSPSGRPFTVADKGRPVTRIFG